MTDLPEQIPDWAEKKARDIVVQLCGRDGDCYVRVNYSTGNELESLITAALRSRVPRVPAPEIPDPRKAIGAELDHQGFHRAASYLNERPALREAQTRPIENVDGTTEPSNGTVVGGVPDPVAMIVKFCREEAAQSQMGPVVRATWAVAADAIERGEPFKDLQGIPVEGERT